MSVGAGFALCSTTHATTIISESFGGLSSSDLSTDTADSFASAITTAGGSSTWGANTNIKADGSYSISASNGGPAAGDYASAYLNLGSYINDRKGAADGLFTLQLTMTVPNVASWSTIGFATENTPDTAKTFNDAGFGGDSTTGYSTMLYRNTGDIDMFAGAGSGTQVAADDVLYELQRRLIRIGQYLPGYNLEDSEDLARHAVAEASSTFTLDHLKPNEDWLRLDSAWAMVVPLEKGVTPTFGFDISAEKSGSLRVELRRAAKPGNFTPDELVEVNDIPFEKGQSTIRAEFIDPTDRQGYHFVTLLENPDIQVRLSDQRVTGVLAVTNSCNKAVATSSVQLPPEDSGIESFEFWLPKRRPEGHNLAMTVAPPVRLFGPENVIFGPARPTELPNAWVAAIDDPAPELILRWDQPVSIGRVVIEFDPDWDHPLESVLMTHPEEVVPFMVKDFDLIDASGKILAEVRDHHGAHFEWSAPEEVLSTSLLLRIHAAHGAPAAVFRMRVFGRSRK